MTMTGWTGVFTCCFIVELFLPRLDVFMLSLEYVLPLLY